MACTFVLVHGAGHGAWCWYKVVDKLQNAGHTALALDLRSAGLDCAIADEVKTLADYSAPLLQHLRSMAEHDDKIILVGHSLGGVVLSYAMELFPEKIAAAIFVTASMFPAGEKGVELHKKMFEANKDFLNSVDFFYQNGSNTPTSVMTKKEKRSDLLYHLCPSETVQLAHMLLKPSPRFPSSELMVNITPERYGRVPRFFIKATEDRLATPQSQQLYIDTNPPTRVLELPSDHSPFFSTPDLLVEHLIAVASSL